MQQDSEFNPVQGSDDAARRDAEIVAELDEQYAQRSASKNGGSAALLGLAVITALVLPLLLLVAMRSGQSAHASAVPVTAVVAPAAPAGYINWNYSFESGEQQAAATNKIMLVEFYTDWCSACKYMDASVYPDPGVVAETQNVVPVKINAEVRTDLAQHYSINSYPTFVWMDASGVERTRVSNTFAPADFVAVLQHNR